MLEFYFITVYTYGNSKPLRVLGWDLSAICGTIKSSLQAFRFDTGFYKRLIQCSDAGFHFTSNQLMLQHHLSTAVQEKKKNTYVLFILFLCILLLSKDSFERALSIFNKNKAQDIGVFVIEYFNVLYLRKIPKWSETNQT